jgi:UDP-2,3-diacylglucosamine pyrophosphatase LpxH
MNAVSPGQATRHYRAVFISDVHLGTRDCRADFLADFLRRVSCDQLYLVGDIIDGWRLRRSWHWDEAHNEVVRLIFRHACNGAEVIYIPGNHDEMLRRWVGLGLQVGGVRLAGEAVHVTADGRKLLVIHGDAFDSVSCHARPLAILGDYAYGAALVLNRWFNAARHRLGYPYWSISAWAKRQVKRVVKTIDRFEEALTAEAARRGFDGVVCGHIHHAEMRNIDGRIYINDGDWVESCTAVVEHADGRLELVEWAALNSFSFFARPHGRRRAEMPEAV